MPESTYLIVDSCLDNETAFITNFGFLIFPSLSDYFPSEINQNLASENKNPTILNMIGFSFIFDARLLILGRINNESYVS